MRRRTSRPVTAPAAGKHRLASSAPSPLAAAALRAASRSQNDAGCTAAIAADSDGDSDEITAEDVATVVAAVGAATSASPHARSPRAPASSPWPKRLRMGSDRQLRQPPLRAHAAAPTAKSSGIPDYLLRLRPTWERPASAPVMRIPQPPPPPPPKPDVLVKAADGRTLRRHSFIAPQPGGAASRPSGRVPLARDGAPSSGAFTPLGGFYAESSLAYEFVVRPSVLFDAHLRNGDTIQRVTEHNDGDSSSSANVAGRNGAMDEEGTAPHPRWRRASEDVAVARPCEASVLVPMEERDLVAAASANALLRRVANHLPHHGTRLVVTMRRLWFQRRAVDVTMSFEYADCLNFAPHIAEMLPSIVRESTLIGRARRCGNAIVCPASESLCEHLYEYCVARMECDHPECAIDALVFIDHCVADGDGDDGGDAPATGAETPRSTLLELSPPVERVAVPLIDPSTADDRARLGGFGVSSCAMSQRAATRMPPTTA